MEDVAEFERGWLSWWNALQPAGRRNGVLVPFGIYDVEADWSELRKSGPNGFVMAIIALTWWGISGASETWFKAVTDVSRVLEVLAGLAAS
jgi:hypothetical protein